MPRNTHGYSEEELALLTEEELAGLEDDSIVDEGAAAGAEDDETDDDAASAAAAADAGEEQPEKDAEAAAAPEPEKEPAEPEKKAPAPDAAPVTEAEAEAAAAPETTQAAPRLLPQYELPADAKERIAQFDAQIDEFAKKFDEGELTAQEYRAALKPIEQQRQDLRDQMLKHQLSLDALVSQWSNVTVPAFLAKHAEYESGSVLFNLLNDEVKKLQVESDNPLDPTHLEVAHRTIQAAIRKSYGLPAETPAASTEKTAKQKREIPPTLGGLPSSDITEAADGGEFAYLDRLADNDPVAYEDAIAKLSPEKLEAYLAA